MRYFRLGGDGGALVVNTHKELYDVTILC